MPKLHNVYLLLGSNEGNKTEMIDEARRLLTESVGKQIEVSHYYETQPWGVTNQPDFVNLAISLKTSLSVRQVLDATQRIEDKLGRERGEEQYGPRNIDIDILMYDQFVVDEPNLIIPHPRLAERNFMLVPLMEIAPELEHPVLQKTIEELYFDSPDNLEVYMLDDV